MKSGTATGAPAIDAIRVGLGYVPTASRFYGALSKVVSDFESGVTEREFFTEFHKRWDFRNQHHMVHTVSNTEIVAAALLYGNDDYGRTVCITVENGFSFSLHLPQAAVELKATKLSHTSKYLFVLYQRYALLFS